MKKELRLPCMFHPTKVCKDSCLLYYLNLAGVTIGNKTQSEIENALTELRLQPEARARAHELRIRGVDPFIGLDCEQVKKN